MAGGELSEEANGVEFVIVDGDSNSSLSFEDGDHGAGAR